MKEKLVDPLAGRVTIAAAEAEARCLCEGCAYCRGVTGFPCGITACGKLLCQWCAERLPASPDPCPCPIHRGRK